MKGVKTGMQLPSPYTEIALHCNSRWKLFIKCTVWKSHC